MAHDGFTAFKSVASRRNTAIVAVGVVALLAASVAYAVLHGDRPETPASNAEKPVASASGSPSRVTTAATAVAPGKASRAATKTAPGAISRPGVMSQPAVKGSRLTTLSAPPEQTIGMIVVPKDLTVARFRVTFEPFGWGPSAASGERLIARVLASEPVDDAAKSLDRDFASRNVTLWIAAEKAKAIRIGGTYSGVIEVRRQGDVGVMHLVEVAGK